MRRCTIKTRYETRMLQDTCATLVSGISGFVLSTPNATSSGNFLAGAAKRNLAYMTPPNKGVMRKFREFVRCFLRRHLTPLNHLLTFEEWLEQAPYTQSRKQQLMNTYMKNLDYIGLCRTQIDQQLKSNKVLPLFNKLLLVKSFTKREFYDIRGDAEDKFARAINSRSDLYKCIVGPIITSLEHEVFKLPWFIKHVPEDQRSKYISEFLAGNFRHVFTTDYRSFEQTITKDMMSVCEFQLYKYMLAAFPGEAKWLFLQGIENKQVYHGVEITAPAIRMSGEMNTSLGNGFTNLMVMMFACSLADDGFECSRFRGIFEGDDGLTVTNHMPDVKTWNDLGFVIDLQEVENVQEGSFCRRIYATEDTSTLGDPVRYLASAGWSFKAVNVSDRTRRMLTYSKGLSYVHTFAGCPIIGSLGKLLMRSAEVADDDFDIWLSKTSLLDLYEKERAVHATFREPSPYARALVAKHFGIPPALQLLVERILDQSKGWVEHPIFHAFMDPRHAMNWKMTTDVRLKEPDIPFKSVTKRIEEKHTFELSEFRV